MRVGPGALIIALGIASAGCGGHAPPARTGEVDRAARTFGTRLIDVLERDDLDGFQELLSDRLRDRQGRELGELFATWRATLVPFAQALRDADWTVAHTEPRLVVRFRAIGRTPEPLVHVVEERGALRIDDRTPVDRRGDRPARRHGEG